MAMKGLIFNTFPLWEGVVALEGLIFDHFHLGGDGAPQSTVLGQFLLWG